MAQFVKRNKNKKKLNKRLSTCSLCANGIDEVSYLDIYRLKKFVSRKGKIISRFRSGNCSKHQRNVTRAIKRARISALMPFSSTE